MFGMKLTPMILLVIVLATMQTTGLGFAQGGNDRALSVTWFKAGTPYYATPVLGSPIGHMSKGSAVHVYEERTDWIRVKIGGQGYFVWLNTTGITSAKAPTFTGHSFDYRPPPPKTYSHPLPRVAKPDCDMLRRYWAELHQKAPFSVWDESTNFDCPSEKSNLAKMFYYLDKIDIVGDDGKEKFDYFDFVIKSPRSIVPSTTSGSKAVIDDIFIGGMYLNIHESGMDVGI